MVNFLKELIDNFHEEVQESPCPWNCNLFKVDANSPNLSKEKAELLNTSVVKGLLGCRRARSDIQPAIAFLTT
jgi:hypothetical protein